MLISEAVRAWEGIEELYSGLTSVACTALELTISGHVRSVFSAM